MEVIFDVTNNVGRENTCKQSDAGMAVVGV